MLEPLETMEDTQKLAIRWKMSRERKYHVIFVSLLLLIVKRFLSSEIISFIFLFPLRVQMLKESADGKDITLIFPKGKSLYEVDWLGFISRKKKVLRHYHYLRILQTRFVRLLINLYWKWIFDYLGIIQPCYCERWCQRKNSSIPNSSPDTSRKKWFIGFVISYSWLKNYNDQGLYLYGSCSR